jgi:endo-1,4-beta-xylanase
MDLIGPEVASMTIRQKILAGVALVALAATTAGCAFDRDDIKPQPTHSASEVAPQHDQVDLIADRHWQMAGVEVKDRSLSVTSKELAIVKQDGSEGQPNPPVNLFGSRLAVTGDFSIAAKISDITKEAGLSLYGQPPLIEDEFRAEIATLDMAIEDDSFWVGVSNATDGNFVEEKNFDIDAKAEHTLQVVNEKGELHFVIDGKEVGRVADHGIFGNGQVWIGMDARTPGSRFSVNELKAKGLNGGQVAAVDTRSSEISQSPTGLNALVAQRRQGFFLGAAVALGPMVADTKYREALGNFGAVSIENALKFQFVHPLPGNGLGSYNFSEADAIVDMAQKAGMKIHGHALVFGEANPAWLQQLAESDPTQFRQAQTDHVKTITSRYKGKIQSWDINEVLADYDTAPGQHGLRQNIYYRAIGPDYIADTANAIKETDPNAEIWLNDFGMESDDDRFEQMLEVLDRLAKQGVHITGVGFQAHIDEGDTIKSNSTIDAEKLKSRIAVLENLGYKSRISELDISDPAQSAVYADVVTTCIQQPSCVSVTTWGVADKYSSSGEVDEQGILHTGQGLLWTNDYTETQALKRLRASLQ